jgi:hypothetical protein
LSVHPEEQSHLVPGYRLDRYELLCPIGTGGMASVWVARLLGKHGFEKLVAIKTILTRYARDPHFQQMFLDEARIASRIHHPNVAQILDLGDHQGVLFLAMEWIEGDALSKLARAVHDRGLVFPPGIALRIVADVCAGLHAAHELCDRNGAPLGIVHRDVSPHNILIGDQGVAKVIDFGIAKARDRVAGDTETGSFKGKVKYMAPEQALSPRSTDRRADLWAVGAILYYLLSGRPPYESENDVATLAQLAAGKPPLPLPSHAPEPVRAVTARALAWKPNDRYATADELRVAVEDAMLEIGITTTSAEVAAFCARHLADRADARRKAVALALSAAEERSRVLRLLTPAEDSSKTSRLAAQAVPATGSPLPVPSTPAASAETSPTLGAAATMTTSPVSYPTRRRWGIVAALTSVATIAIVLVASLAHRGGEGANTVGAAAAPPEARTVPSASAAIAATAAKTATPADVSTAATSAPSAPAAGASSAPSAASAPSAPAAGRHRAPATRSPGTNSPATVGTIKHRAEYGF